jgi:hypothetical protein
VDAGRSRKSNRQDCDCDVLELGDRNYAAATSGGPTTRSKQRRGVTSRTSASACKRDPAEDRSGLDPGGRRTVGSTLEGLLHVRGGRPCQSATDVRPSPPELGTR